MLTILTEKPSAARNFAAALGGQTGTYNGEDYRIVNARGHLLELKKPEKQVPKEKAEEYRIWDTDTLPWKLEDFSWTKEVIRSKGVPEILDNISAAFKTSDEVVIATDDDPSGEGEMLAFEILEHLKWNGKTSRMYFPDESPKSIRAAFTSRKQLSPDPMKDGDYVKAITRQRWDFFSMQWSRIATCTAGTCGYRRILRMGRLKSVMISLVGDQEDAIRNYKKIPYYEIRYKDENGNIYAVKKEDAVRVADKSQLDVTQYFRSDVVVTSVETKKTPPGKLLDLAGISANLASKGFKPKRILDVYQSMYDDHILSYPRTEDKKITPEQFNELLPLVDDICRVVGVDPALITVRTPRKTHVDEKAGSHGANRPGTKVPASLDALRDRYGPEAPAIYELVAKNYLAMMGEDYVYEQQKGHVKDFPEFRGVSNIPMSMGFKQVFDDSDKKEENAKPLGKTADSYIHEGVNKKPEKPTIKWLTKRLEKFNVGTGATRTATIAEVSKPDATKGLMNEKKGVLSLTENGQMAHCLLSGCNIASVEMTEKLFTAMQSIGKFEQDPHAILKGIDELLMSDLATMQANRKDLLSRFGQGTETKGPAQKEEGIYEPTGEVITFKRTWGKHTFTDDEIALLLKGKEIAFEYPSSTGEPSIVKGIFGQSEYKNRTFWGFIKQSDSAYASGMHAPTGKEVTFKRIWNGYRFSDEEVQLLLDGESLTISAVSSKGQRYTATGRLGEGSFKGRKFWGFQTDTYETEDNGKIKGIYAPTGQEVSFKKVWGGHEFTEEEIKKLLAGEMLMFTYYGKKGEATAVGKLDEGEYKGKKYWGFQKAGK